MTEERLETVYEAEKMWNRGEVSGLRSLYTTNFRNYDPARSRTTDLDSLESFIRDTHAAMPDFQVQLDEAFACGDRVVTRWTASGTQKGELAGIPPTNKFAEWSGITIYRFEGTKIAEAWWAYDMLGILEQLGVAPARQGRTTMPPQGMVHPERESPR